MNGVYGFVYSGLTGIGIGVFKVTDGVLVGVDFAGGRYRGRVTEDPVSGEIDLSFEMTVPVGAFIVQGTSAQDMEYTKIGSQKVPPRFGDGKPFEMSLAPSYVTLMVKPIPDNFSAYVNGIDIRIMPSGA